MVIHSQAEIPLKSDKLDEALREFAEFVRRYLAAADGSQVSIGLMESGSRGNSVVAETVPDESKEFGLDWMPVGAPLTAAEFRAAVAGKKIKKTRSQLRLGAESIVDVSGLAAKLAEALPASGRGVMLLFYLNGWRFAGDMKGPAVDATFSRFRQGARALTATVGLRFQALSMKDPVVAATISPASERVGLKFGKPMASFATDVQGFVVSPPAPVVTPDPEPHLEPPSTGSQLIVLQTFQEALARAADRIGAQAGDLKSLPFLFSRFESATKRINDVMAGRKESIDLTAQIKRFMKERFPDYKFDAADAEQVWFRKPIARTLDLMLMFDKIYQHRLGKTFSVEFGVDFPNTPFGAMYSGWGGTRANIFRLFHKGWDVQVWSYADSAELAKALAGCGTLLARVLPALEEQCRALLLPLPSELPEGIEQRGPLSARDAFGLVMPVARQWAPDAQLEGVGSTNILRQQGVTSSITPEGRLQPEGSWSFKFLSRQLDEYCHFTVPHTGRIQWNSMSVMQGAIPKYNAVLATEDWIDSTEVAPRAFAEIERLADGLHVAHIFLSLHDPKRYEGNFCWEAHCMAIGDSPSERRDIRLQFDPRTGQLVGAEGNNSE
jgi:hypothetical protein